MKKISYNLDNYDGDNVAERTLAFMHAVFIKDINTKIIPCSENGKKTFLLQETDGTESYVFCEETTEEVNK